MRGGIDVGVGSWKRRGRLLDPAHRVHKLLPGTAKLRLRIGSSPCNFAMAMDRFDHIHLTRLSALLALPAREAPAP